MPCFNNCIVVTQISSFLKDLKLHGEKQTRISKIKRRKIKSWVKTGCVCNLKYPSKAVKFFLSVPWHWGSAELSKSKIRPGIFTSSLRYGNDFSSSFALYFSYTQPCLGYFYSILEMLIMSPCTQWTLSAFCKLYRLFWLHCTPYEGRGWKQTAQSNTHTPLFSCVLCPMTQSHTSWKIYTETLANFEGKFHNTYLFWINL